MTAADTERKPRSPRTRKPKVPVQTSVEPTDEQPDRVVRREIQAVFVQTVIRCFNAAGKPVDEMTQPEPMRFLSAELAVQALLAQEQELALEAAANNGKKPDA